MSSILSFLSTACLLVGTYAQTRSEYDYIICGGGTAGLVIANKLTEDSDVSVLVVEAADLESVSSWDYRSAPQTYVDDRVLTLPAGRAVGGTTEINGKAYIRPESNSIDDWGSANNAGWSWDTLFPFYKSSEALDLPNEEQIALGASINPEYHGTNGSVRLSFPAVGSARFYDILVDTFENFSIPRIVDVNGGDARGVCTWPGQFTIQGEREQIRASARDNYYTPVADRTNLELLTGTTCLRLVWGDSDDEDDVTASGVEIANANNQTTVNATQEIILSAGTYRSPVILEYSGVGNPDILDRFGVDSVVELPGVGENLQDQMTGSVTYTRGNGSSDVVFPATVGDAEIISPYIAHLTHSDVFGDVADEVQARLENSLPDLAREMSERINGSLSADQIMNSLQIQYNALFVDNVPALEILSRMAQNNNEINLEFWPLISLNRGNVHISGGNAVIASSRPIIDNNWGQTIYDWDIYIAGAKYVRNMFATPPLADLVANETRPGFEQVPEDASDDEWKAYWFGQFRAGWHAIGSCAMLPRAWGGVVDGDLRVYGTANVRVVDASVIPFMLAGHPTSTVYALAERAAQLIISGESG